MKVFFMKKSNFKSCCVFTSEGQWGLTFLYLAIHSLRKCIDIVIFRAIGRIISYEIF